MSIHRILCLTALLLCLSVRPFCASAEERQPTATVAYAQHDSITLQLDIYAPTPGSATTYDGKPKPTVLFIFGGGFMEGRRDNPWDRRWFGMLADEGYSVVSIDYRLGLKGYTGAGINKRFLTATQAAIDMAVDDLYDATLWLLEHGSDYGIDARNMVISGSSAGAITSMQAEYELANRTARCAQMPADFNYAGVMSFAGAIYTFRGGPKYDNEPCPILLLHGTEDHIVSYKKIAIGRIFFGGAKPLAKTYARRGFNYNAYRYVGHGHEIANNMILSFPEEIRFLETNVIRGQKRIIDTLVDDPDIKVPDWGKSNYKKLYK